MSDYLNAHCIANDGQRDILDLLDKGILVKLAAGGRSTIYGVK